MSHSLTPDHVAAFQKQGYVGPFPALTDEEVDFYRSKLEAFEASQGMTFSEMPGQVRAKSHLLFTWLDSLVRHPRVLDLVQGLIGPDILVYHLTCWPKDSGDGKFVSWHQDGTYFYLEPFEEVTAWVALTDSTPENGCVRVLPGSHALGQLEHVFGDTRGNLLSNGQHVNLPIVEEEAAYLSVPKGHVTFHHTHLVHSSGPNWTDGRRIGIGISYIPTHVRYVAEGRLYASLVRGTDRFGHFDAELRPKADFDDAARAFHAEACAKFFQSHGSRRTADEDAEVRDGAS